MPSVSLETEKLVPLTLVDVVNSLNMPYSLETSKDKTLCSILTR